MSEPKDFALHCIVQCKKWLHEKVLNPVTLIHFVAIAMLAIMYLMVKSVLLNTQAWASLVVHVQELAHNPDATAPAMIASNMGSASRILLFCVIAQVVGCLLLMGATLWMKIEKTKRAKEVA